MSWEDKLYEMEHPDDVIDKLRIENDRLEVENQSLRIAAERLKAQLADSLRGQAVYESELGHIKADNDRLNCTIKNMRSEFSRSVIRTEILADCLLLTFGDGHQEHRPHNPDKSLDIGDDAEKIFVHHSLLLDPYVWNCGDCHWEGPESQIARLNKPGGSEIERVCPQCWGNGFYSTLRKRSIADTEPKTV